MNRLPLTQADPFAGEADLGYWTKAGYRGCFVYVLQAPPLIPVKIGFTSSLPERTKTLQTGCPYELRCRCLIPADQSLETWLHRSLKPYRLAGEWFEGEPVWEVLGRLETAATQMVADHDGVVDPPDYLDYMKWLPYRRKKTPPSYGPPVKALGDVAISFTDPQPLTEEAQQANLRAHYLRPARATEKGEWAPER